MLLKGAVITSMIPGEIGQSNILSILYLPVYNARPCITRILIVDYILRKKKERLKGLTFGK